MTSDTRILEGKVALVTGGNSGIGRAIALSFAKSGASVVIVGRNQKRLEEVAALHEKITPFQIDLLDEDAPDRIVQFLHDNFNGRLDILVNNAGWCPVQSILEASIEDYDKAFSLDVRSVVALTIKSLPLLLKTRGNIINLSSVGATHPAKNLSMYVAAKAAIENFTKGWALDLASSGIRVNAIAPGAIETNIWNATDLSAEDALKHKQKIVDEIPLGRMGKAEEVANVALFLASDAASYVSGSIYAIDGASGAM